MNFKCLEVLGYPAEEPDPTPRVCSPVWWATRVAGVSAREAEVSNMGEVEMKVEVVCYSGYKGDERPVRFRLGGEDYFVEELLDQWYGPEDVFFKVRANDGNVYILRRRSSAPDGEWCLESARDMMRGG